MDFRRTLGVDADEVVAVAVLADGSRALPGSTDKTLKLWDLASGDCLATSYAEGAIASLGVASQQRFIIGDESGAVTVLELVEEARP